MRSLSLVADAPATLSRIQRIRGLQQEARLLARDHIRALTDAMAEGASLAAEIADGGDVFPPGIRDLARRMVEDTEARAGTLEALLARAM